MEGAGEVTLVVTRVILVVTLVPHEKKLPVRTREITQHRNLSHCPQEVREAREEAEEVAEEAGQAQQHKTVLEHSPRIISHYLLILVRRRGTQCLRLMCTNAGPWLHLLLYCCFIVTL